MNVRSDNRPGTPSLRSKRADATTRAVPVRRRLGLEALEDRQLMSCTVGTADGDDGILMVRGDGAANSVEILLDGEGGADVICDEVTESFTAISRLDVRTKGGNDIIRVELEGDLNQALKLDVRSGSGNDAVSLNLAGLEASDREAECGEPLVVNAELDLEIRTGAGDDHVSMSLVSSPAEASRLALRLGAGDDVAEVAAFGGDLNWSVAVRGAGGEDSASVFGPVLDGVDESLFDVRGIEAAEFTPFDALNPCEPAPIPED